MSLIDSLPDRPISPETEERIHNTDAVQCVHPTLTIGTPTGMPKHYPQLIIYLVSGRGHALHFDPVDAVWRLIGSATGDHDPVIEDELRPLLDEKRTDVYTSLLWVRFSKGSIEEVDADVRDEVRKILAGIEASSQRPNTREEVGR